MTRRRRRRRRSKIGGMVEKKCRKPLMPPAEVTPIVVDAFGLTAGQRRLLSDARFCGLIRSGALNTLADRGAQLIISIGAEEAHRLFPEGLKVSLPEDEFLKMQRLLSMSEKEIAALRRKAAVQQEEVDRFNRSRRTGLI
ncbi:MAG: hypothetical protein Q8N98_02025 [bacterium]|nr:hypothetical protein [bacterium]